MSSVWKPLLRHADVTLQCLLSLSGRKWVPCGVFTEAWLLLAVYSFPILDGFSGADRVFPICPGFPQSSFLPFAGYSFLSLVLLQCLSTMNRSPCDDILLILAGFSCSNMVFLAWLDSPAAVVQSCYGPQRRATGSMGHNDAAEHNGTVDGAGRVIHNGSQPLWCWQSQEILSTICV